MTTAVAHTIAGMATLTVLELESRLAGADDELRAVQADYRRLADERTRADMDREVALATAFTAAEGNHFERRNAAVEKVGVQGVETRASYARVAADVEILHSRVIALSALLKSAKGREASARYASGP
jgi:hypothetical protein